MEVIRHDAKINQFDISLSYDFLANVEG